jgi:FkbM family methyltransferase
MLLRNSRVLGNIATIEALWRRYGVDLAYEQVIERSYRQFLRHGDTVIDVGAHAGTHTSVFLDIVGPSGRVIAFEPLPDLCAGLRARLGPRHPNLSVLQLALSSAPATEAAFVRAEGSLAESGLRQREYNDSDAVQPTEIRVMVDTIDAVAKRLALTSLAYIKMDIEGGELDALDGACETVQRFRPVISVEFGRQAYSAYVPHRLPHPRSVHAIHRLAPVMGSRKEPLLLGLLSRPRGTGARGPAMVPAVLSRCCYRNTHPIEHIFAKLYRFAAQPQCRLSLARTDR